MINKVLAVKIIILLTAIVGALTFIVAIETRDRADHQKYLNDLDKYYKRDIEGKK